MKSLIHFVHANGIPSPVYKKLFDELQLNSDIVYLEKIGPDKRYPITDGWKYLVDQVIDNIVQKSHGRKVIGLGHSLGSVLTLMASYKRPELFEHVIMLDPPLVHGQTSWLLQVAKIFSPNTVDKITPAHLSIRRRDHWKTYDEAYKLLNKKDFYKKFDPECFQAYIKYGLSYDPERKGITLTIPKKDEVDIFRTRPSFWWLSASNPTVPVDIIAGVDSLFSKKGLPQIARKRLGIPIHFINGGHMFPLQYPLETAKTVEELIFRGK